MRRRLPILFLAIVLAGIGVAGCGGDDKSDKASKVETAAKTETSPASSSTDAERKKKAEKAEAAAEAKRKAKRDDELLATKGKPKPVTPKQVRKKFVDSCKEGFKKRAPNANQQRAGELCEKATPPADGADPAAGGGDEKAKAELNRQACLAEVEQSGLSGTGAELAKKQCETLGQ